MKTRGSLVFAVAALVLVGCGKQTGRQDESRSAATDTTSATPPIVTAPTLEELRSATYAGIAGLPDTVTLHSGRWEGAPTVEGGAARPALQFVRNFRLVGDVDQDGDEDAVVLLGMTTGGSGELVYLAVVLREGTSVRHAGSALLGDRVQVRAARIDGNRVVFGLVQAGKADAMCCPGELVERVWTFSDRGLEELPAEFPPGRLSLATLEGTEWVLRSWTSYEPIRPYEPEITVRFEGGRISGSSGCNRYFAQLAAGRQPGDVSISPLGGTRMTCQDPAFSTEARFVRQLSGLKKYGFIAAQLALYYEENSTVEFMLFDARPTGGE